MKNLVFLLLPLLLVFGVLIGLSLVLWLRHARERKSGARGPGALLRAGPEDVVSVLGRLFQIVLVCPLALPSGAKLWFGLKDDEGECRLWLSQDLSGASFFPGRGKAPADGGFPSEINREEGTHSRVDQPISICAGTEVALYAGPGEYCLALERAGDCRILWRGKAIPVEGVFLFQEGT